MVPGPTLPITQRCRPSAELLGRLARQFAAALVDLERPVGDVELGQRDRRAAERVGLHHVGAGLEVAAMDVAHQVGAREVQHVGAVLLAVEVALDVERHALHAAAHGAVAQQHGVAQRIEQMRSGHSAVSFRRQLRGSCAIGASAARVAGHRRTASGPSIVHRRALLHAGAVQQPAHRVIAEAGPAMRQSG